MARAQVIALTLMVVADAGLTATVPGQPRTCPTLGFNAPRNDQLTTAPLDPHRPAPG